ncbi:MAG: hypothetical protein AAFU64_18205, partial [Bacteroidota bacterium]
MLAQNTVDGVMAQAARDSVSLYAIEPGPFSHFKVEMNFEASLVLNPDDLSALPAYDIVAIDLVYTLFPPGKRFDSLNRARLRALEAIFPTLLQKSNIHWRFIGQSQAPNRSQAQRLFHGFVIYYRNFEKLEPLPLLPDIPLSSSDQAPDYGNALVMNELLRDEIVSDDSVVF